jgi:hypothetical protein
MVRKTSNVVLALGLLGCGLSGKKASESIQKELTDKGVEIESVVCPEGKKDKDGETFECEGFTKDSQKFVVDVHAKGGGNITWELRGRIVDPKELEDKLAKDSGAQFDCGDKARIAVQESKIECSAGEQKLAIVFSNDKGDYEVKQQ